MQSEETSCKDICKAGTELGSQGTSTLLRSDQRKLSIGSLTDTAWLSRQDCKGGFAIHVCSMRFPGSHTSSHHWLQCSWAVVIVCTQIQQMLEDADRFVLKTITNKYNAASYLSDGENVVKLAEEIIENAAKADRLSMVKTSDYCENWLVMRFKFYQEALPKLLQLRHEIIARVMQGVANRLKHY